MSDVVDLLTRIESALDIDIPDEFYDEARSLDDDYAGLEMRARDAEDERDALENDCLAAEKRLDELEADEGIVAAVKEQADRQRWGLDYIANYDELIAEARR